MSLKTTQSIIIAITFCLSACNSVDGNDPFDPTPDTTLGSISTVDDAKDGEANASDTGSTEVSGSSEDSSSTALTYVAAKLNSLDPWAVPVGSASAPTIRILGEDFDSGAVVQIDGIAVDATFVDAKEMMVTPTGLGFSQAGVYQIAVVNPNADVSNTLAFEVTSFGITGLSPASSAIRQALTVSIEGFGFQESDSVLFNDELHASNFISENQIEIDLDASETASAGSYSVVVTSASSNSNGASFTVTEPHITGISPLGAVANSTPFSLTINGEGFFDGQTVSVADSTSSIQYSVDNVNVVSSTKIIADVTLSAVPPQNNYAIVSVSQSSDTVLMGVANASVSFAGNVQPILDTSCAKNGCHDSTSARTGLDLTSGNAYANLVNVASSKCAGELVVPGDPRTEVSVLINKILLSNPCSGGTMPKGQLSTANKQVIVDWVALGANND